MKQRIPKAIYSKELREQAVKLVTDEGLGLQEPSGCHCRHRRWITGYGRPEMASWVRLANRNAH